MKIIFATNNEHKLREVQQILGNRYEVMSLADIGCAEDIPETADTLEGNACLKAQYVYEKYGEKLGALVFADDTGLEVEALGGEPGVRTARYAGEQHDTDANVNLLLKNLENQDNRRACFRTVIALIDTVGRVSTMDGRVDGEITTERMGANGFGYDPVFRPEGYDGTFAELGDKIKNQISHRARAVQKLVAHLKTMTMKNITTKTFFTTLLMALATLFPAFNASTAMAQEPGTWTQHPAYGTAQQSLVSGNQLWVVASGNLWAMDLETNEIVTFDRVRGMSDVEISSIACSPTCDNIVVVYKNSNIDIVNVSTHEVRNIPHIKNSSEPLTDINDISLLGDEAWVSTAFGLVRINIEECYIIDTYKFDGGVITACATDATPSSSGLPSPSAPMLYISTDEGISYAPLSANLHDRSVFKLLVQPTSNILHLRWWKGNLLAINENSIIRVNPLTGYFNYVHDSEFSAMRDLTLWDDGLVVASGTLVFALNDKFDITMRQSRTDALSVAAKGKQVFVCAGTNGVVPYNIEGTSLVQAGEAIKVNGPNVNNVYRLRYAKDRLLLVCGGQEASMSVTENAADLMDADGTWTNLELQPVISNTNFYGLTDIIEDPNDPDHHFVSSFGHGVFEYRGTQVVNRYSAANSLLHALPNHSNADKYTRVTAMCYDTEGNLWMVNGGDSLIFVCMKTDGQWTGKKVANPAPMSFCNGFAIDNNYMWAAMWSWNDGDGIYGIDNGGTPTVFRDDKTGWVANKLTQQDGVSYDMGLPLSIAVDRERQVWMGCQAGLFVIPNPADFFGSGFTFHQVKINRNDGSGLADYLLNGLWCTTIAVDPANRKWVGTDGQGVYLISADGQEEIMHFTTDNSPLPSDHITSIAVSQTTGMVAIGTARGLITYRGDAVEPEDALDADNIVCYPNPIPPNYQGNVNITGLTDGAEVKIATVTGQVIYRTHANGGMATWNCRDARGRRVATGVYNVIANTHDGSDAAVTRIVVTN